MCGETWIQIKGRKKAENVFYSVTSDTDHKYMGV
jgi:hypothetical protein